MEGKRIHAISISGEATYKISGLPLAPVDVIVREISKDGLKFVTSSTLEPDTQIELNIKITSIVDPIHATARVLWQRKLSSKFLLDTSVEFIKIDDESTNKLVKYIYEYAASSVISREFLRVSLITDVTFYDLSNENIKVKCLSADIGVKGMKLIVAEMTAVDTYLMLKFNLPDDLPELSLKGKVVWAKEGADNVLGIRFDKLEDEVLNRVIKYVEAQVSSS